MTVRLKILTAFSLLLMAATLLSAPLARAGGDDIGGFICNGAGNFTGTITIGNLTFVNSAGCN